MRIVAGKHRGRRLLAPPGGTGRTTSDPARGVFPPRRADIRRRAACISAPRRNYGRSEMSDQLRYVTLRDGERVPALGQGTWHMGENRRRAADEAAALRLGIDLGMTLID